jgi:uncharacterized membrane protein
MKSQMARWQANFYTGLAIILPAVISIAVVKWLFGTVSNLTDPLLFFLPRGWTHNPAGNMYWWWSLFALVLSLGIIAAIGRMARNYIGRKLIKLMDDVLLRVPLLNKIYGAIKQVNAAFTSNNKSSFKQVVLIEFPRPGLFSVGFITGDQHGEVQHKTQAKIVSVFVPTTPNPTTGFLVLLPEETVTKLEMSVADGIKFIISLGSVAPDYVPIHAPKANLALPLVDKSELFTAETKI